MITVVWSPGFSRSDFEYRKVFEFVTNPKTGEEEILLEAIGTHEEVY